MLFYNSSTNKRYNERTLALYGFSQGDSDVHPLVVEYPTVDTRYETYRDTQEVDYVDGQYIVRFEVVNLPKERVIENTQAMYTQALEVLRSETLVIGDHRVQSPKTNLSTFKAWAAALADDIPFEPNENPFIGTPPTMTTTLVNELIAGIETHLGHCNTISGEVDAYLNTSDIDTLKATEPAEWVQARYDALSNA